MNFADHIRRASQVLARRDGHGPVPTRDQATAAIAYAEIAKAQAMERIAVALEALAADTALAGVTLAPSIGHSN